jgi:hypothetical protein
MKKNLKMALIGYVLVLMPVIQLMTYKDQQAKK